MKSVCIKEFIGQLGFLKPLTPVVDDCCIHELEISRPGLSLTGYLHDFRENRIQVIGTLEHKYLEKFGFTTKNIKNMLEFDIPLIVFSRSYHPPKEFLDLCISSGVTVCNTKLSSTKLQTMLFSKLEFMLAPETQVHGVLLSVHGVGILIKGGSGIGKSEVALELINRGHLLVADDAVLIKKIDESTLIGTAPQLLKNRLEIRGVGIVDIQKLYGVTKVISSKKINLVVEIKPLSGQEDRIGTNIKSEMILDTKIAKIEIPITPGRTLSNLIEVAVANFELKHSHGYDSAASFVEDLNRLLVGKKNE